MASEDRTPDTSSAIRLRARALKWLLTALLAIIALVSAVYFALNTPIGQRFIADRIAQMAPASGLRIDIGRIEGDIYGKAKLHDVTLSDPQGEFLKVPLVELDWRPLSWINRGLDVRELVSHRGTLLRVPELNPGDPDAPILPDFDIRIDRFEIDGLTIRQGVVDERSHRVDLKSAVDIREGRALIRVDGKFGQQDTFFALLDAEPDGDVFDIALDYDAPRGGVIAGLLGAEAGYSARIDGEGRWSDWKGGLYVTRNGESFAAFRLTNKAGRYAILGQAFPKAALSGPLSGLLGDKVSLAASGVLEESVIDGEFDLRGRGIDLDGEGAVDLAGNAFVEFEVAGRLRSENALSRDFALRQARFDATIDGDFRDLEIAHTVRIEQLISGETRANQLRQSGTARFDGERLLFPIDMRIGSIETGIQWVDPQLVDGRLSGEFVYRGERLSSDALAIRFAGADARLALRGNISAGTYQLSGPVNVSSLEFETIGRVGGQARIVYRTGGSAPWSLQADIDGQVTDVSNATITGLVGSTINFTGEVGVGGGVPLTFNGVNIRADQLSAQIDGSVADGTTTLAGTGQHLEYGPFTVEAAWAAEGPQAVLVFADPLPAAGLADVRVALSPTSDGFRIRTEGGSMLGPFNGTLDLVTPADGLTRLAIEQLRIWQTDVTGTVALDDDGARGSLTLAGGGLDGTVALTPRGGGQGFDADITANGARFAGPTPLTIARADIDMSATFADGSSRIQGDAIAQGVSYGTLFIGRIASRAELENGSGKVLASISGRRGSQFKLDFDANLAPKRIALAAKGNFAGEPISMPRRAVLTAVDGGGWQLDRTQVSYADGHALISGRLGTPNGTDFALKLADMPLSLVDMVLADLGLGGSVSGVIDYRVGPDELPTSEVRVKVRELRRSGLVLTSTPVDLALALNLTRDQMRMRAAIDEDGERRGRIQAHLSELPERGTLTERLRNAPLMAQLRYDGPATALWRLAAIDAFDLTGNVQITADATGTLDDPQVRGALAGDRLRFESALTGTNFRNVSVRGRFAGSQLTITRLSGTTAGVGSVTGSGTVDLDGIGERVGPGGAIRGPGLDIKLAARGARIVNANGLRATVTGPLRIVSNGIGGTIAGRLRIEQASWRLGTYEDDASIPQIATREINVPANVAPTRAASPPWRFLVDASSPSRIDVDGMGLDSEWGADLIIRGTTADPRIGGTARVVRGGYSFAGTRFELTRGRITFDENVPIDPRLDIRAETERDGLEVEVSVTGNALRPEIAFASTPPVPEEEILSRLLFGDSVTELSATDALQLGAAVASLRGGGGMDPINQLRSAIGLDRLRIVGADPALDRGTGVALGKNIGRKFYVEVVTDGRGYSASQLEFKITNWAALLATVSTIGRNSVGAEISKDY